MDVESFEPSLIYLMNRLPVSSRENIDRRLRVSISLDASASSFSSTRNCIQFCTVLFSPTHSFFEWQPRAKRRHKTDHLLMWPRRTWAHRRNPTHLVALPNERSSRWHFCNTLSSLFFFFCHSRRHTLTVQKPLGLPDGLDLSRRPSFNGGRRLSFQQQEVTESSKSKTNLRNFYIFFVALFLFIFIAVVYSFVRMIKNQTS